MYIIICISLHMYIITYVYNFIYKGMMPTYTSTRLVTHRNCQMMSRTRGLNHTVYVVWLKLLQQGEPTTILHPLTHFPRKALQIGWRSQIKCGLLWIVYDWIISHDALGAFQSTVSWWIRHYIYLLTVMRQGWSALSFSIHVTFAKNIILLSTSSIWNGMVL